MEDLIGVFSRLTGQNEDTVKEVLKDLEGEKFAKAAEKLLNDNFGKKLAETESKARIDAEKKQRSLILTEQEKKLKSKYSIESFDDFEDLVEKIHESGKLSSGADEVSVKKIEKLEKDIENIKQSEQTIKSEYEAFKSTTERNVLSGSIRKSALEFLEQNNFVVSGKQRVNDNFIDELLNIADYEVVNGEFIPLIKGTKERLMDDVRNPISAQDLFKKVGMDYYDVKNGTDREPAGAFNTKPTGTGGSKYNIKSIEDFNNAIAGAKTTEELDVIEKEYGAFVASS